MHLGLRAGCRSGAKNKASRLRDAFRALPAKSRFLAPLGMTKLNERSGDKSFNLAIHPFSHLYVKLVTAFLFLAQVACFLGEHLW